MSRFLFVTSTRDVWRGRGLCRKGWAWLRHPNLPGTATPTSPGLGPSFPRSARARSSRAGALPAGTARAPAARGSSSLKAEKRKLLPEPGRGFLRAEKAADLQAERRAPAPHSHTRSPKTSHLFYSPWDPKGTERGFLQQVPTAAPQEVPNPAREPLGDPRELWGCTQADGAAASCAAPAAEGCRSNRFPETGFSALTEQPLPPPPVAMDLRAELLKSIWYAFTALDVEKSGKVSKSQLKVSPWGC